MINSLFQRLCQSDVAIGYACASFGLGLFAMKGIVIKLAYAEELDALTTLGWRMVFALPFYLLIGAYLWKRQPAGREALKQPRILMITLLCGVLSYHVSSYLDFKGLEYVSAQFERLTLYTYPFFVLFFSVLLIGARISLLAVMALAISYAGIALIFAHDMPRAEENYLIGALYVIGAAMIFAFQQVLSKPVINQVGSRLYTSVAMSVASIAVFAHVLVMRPLSDFTLSMNGFWLMLTLAVFCTVMPTYLMNEAVRRIGPQHAASMGGIGPVITAIAAGFILGEAFTLWHAAGTALVLIGVGLFSRHKA